MITADPDLRAVLAHYAGVRQPNGPIEPLGAAGGFSGAAFWRFPSPQGMLLLRRWPAEHPTIERLQFIQAVLWHVHQEGFTRVPLPLETLRLSGFVEQRGHLWELTPWMPGQADYHQHPTSDRLNAALQALAEFHQAAATFPLPETRPAPSPAISQRATQLAHYTRGGLEQLRQQTRAHASRWPELAQRAERLFELCSRTTPQVANLLERACGEEVSLTPCLRDIWHDHVLFQGDEVSALLDFGALRPESVAGDIARLLGSLVGDDKCGWSAGLAAYQRARQLSPAEQRLVGAFDASTVLLSGLHWVEWVFVEGRTFENRNAILTRVDALLARLAHRTAASEKLKLPGKDSNLE